MMGNKIVKLTDIEIETIIMLIKENIREGWYSGNKKHYFKRLDIINKKLGRSHYLMEENKK